VGPPIPRLERSRSWFCIASSSTRQALLTSGKGSWRLVAEMLTGSKDHQTISSAHLARKLHYLK